MSKNSTREVFENLLGIHGSYIILLFYSPPPALTEDVECYSKLF